LPELRLDPVSGLRTIVAGERAGRPGGEFTVEPRPPVDADGDPFLEGHEERTPPEVHALRPGGGAPDTPGWLVRVVPNLYPALGDAETESAAPPDPLAEGRGHPELFSARPAVGAHEVIVNTPQALGSLAELDLEQLETAMGVWRERMRLHGSDAEYVHVIVNEGREAGASLPHTHAQLYALRFVPASIARERERFTAWYERTQGRNLVEDLVQEEVRLRERVVAVDEEAVALSPYAARVPFQMQIVPRRPRARFEDEGPLAAAMLLNVLRRLEAALGALPPFNLWVRTAPRGTDNFCWRIDLLPRLAQLAGLELGAGLNLNIVAPEVAAQRLRDASV
jgi:UDPglucose--hexose-1-phosphate uridylyltransferase